MAESIDISNAEVRAVSPELSTKTATNQSFARNIILKSEVALRMRPCIGDALFNSGTYLIVKTLGQISEWQTFNVDSDAFWVIEFGAGESAECNKTLRGHLVNFTDIPLRPGTVRSGDQAIRSEDNIAVRPKHNNGGPQAVTTEKHRKDYQWQPRYMRIQMRGGEYTNLASGGSFDDVRNQDIDVSNDAIHWFHFGGDVCLRDLPVYKSAH